MSINVNFNLRNPESDNDTPINIVIRYNGLQIVHSSGEKIHPKFWETDGTKGKYYQKAKRGYHNYSYLNSRLDDIKVKVVRTYHKLIDNNNMVPNAKEFKLELAKSLGQIMAEDQKTATLIDFFENYLTDLTTKTNDRTGKFISPNTVKQYKTTLKHLKAFQKVYSRKINWDILDAIFYKDLSNYFFEKKLKVNTVGKQWKNINAIIGQAELHSIIPLNSIVRFKVNHEEVDSLYLEKAELEEWKKLDLSQNAKLERVRDLFVIACYTGSRFSDIHKFTLDNVQNIDGVEFFNIIQQKTQQKVIIPVHPFVKEILNAYKGKSLKVPSYQKMNDYLKEIAKKIEIMHRPFINKYTAEMQGKRCNMITTHTARRTFATHEVLNGTPIRLIMAVTGHKTEKDFWKYVKTDDKTLSLQLHEQWKRKLVLDKVA